MAKRKPISKKTRFEVFKRDSFTCQYCGSKAPEAILEIDHISPVSKGGANDILNLVTACWDCNSGKGGRELSDNSAIEKQRAQLEVLNQRREQLEMMLKWREGLAAIKDEEFNLAEKAIHAHIEGLQLNESGQREIKALVRKYGLSAILDAVEISAEKYLKYGDDGKVDNDSAGNFIQKIGGIAYNNSLPQDEKALRYVRGILRNRFAYVNDRKAMELLKAAQGAGITSDELKAIALFHKNWTGWSSEMEAILRGEG